MNKLFCSFILCGLIASLSACQSEKGNDSTPQNSKLILGKWSLQQQKSVQYIDDVMKTDTTFEITKSNVAYLQFNSNGTYNSVSHYIAQAGPPLTLGNGTIVAANDTTFGTYNIANTDLQLSSSIAGFISSTFSYGATTISTPLPIFAIVSNTSQINTLTVSNLNIHSELIYSTTANGVNTIYKNEFDYYYTK